MFHESIERQITSKLLSILKRWHFGMLLGPQHRSTAEGKTAGQQDGHPSGAMLFS
jgi:hypothetical protein